MLTYDSVTSLPQAVFTFSLLFLATCLPLVAAQDRKAADLDREFQAAVAKYNSGRFTEAAVQIEELITQAPQSFELHELLGLVYSAQSKDAKAATHLQMAVQLQPNSAPARSNLAASLVRLGRLGPAETEFRKAAELEPKNFDTNHNLGEFFVRMGRLPEAAPYLEKAQRIDATSYNNGYDLSLLYLLSGRTSDARRQVGELLKVKDTAELHNLLGQIEEKEDQFVAAANQFQIAAHMDPSEGNLFDWGSELLLHRTLDPAVQVFQEGTQRYPQSARMAIGLGMAYLSRGNYDDAVTWLLRAADLDPNDPRCYPFLSRAYDSSPSQTEPVIQRFRRFADLQPRNARALYFYAMSLWKGRRMKENLDVNQVESLLQKAIALDSSLPEPHLQLGNLYSDQGRYADAIPQYRQALERDSELADAHYRLGQAYVRTGQKEQAQEQLQLYQKLRAEHLAELDKQRADIRQFVYSEKGGGPEKP